MAENDFESFENLDDLDWSDVEDDLKNNREQILSAASEDEPQSLDMNAMASTIEDDDDGNLDIKYLLDVELAISVEVGRSKILISNLLKLDSGNVVELASSIGDPLDIRVNDKLVARGEVVVINEKFGVRITEIINPNDRFTIFQ